MRKLLVTLAILAVLGAAVFFVGWVQLTLEPGTVGVVFSKTSGWEADVVLPGTFVWRWQRLIPTNFTLYTYEPKTHDTTVRADGTLPSGDAIEMLLESANAFDYDVRIAVTWRVRTDRLPSLARDSGLLPDGLETFATTIEARLERIATEATLELIESNSERIALTSAYADITDFVRSRLDRELPEIEILAVNPTRIELPDLDLYVRAREIVQEILDARADALIAAADRIAETQAESDRELLLLERYGEILDRYPVLLEYFRVGQEIGDDPLNIESLIERPAGSDSGR
jgi:hypothetical protein